MLEIQPFDAWAEANATADPSDKIKQYADYVRTNAYKNGQLDDTAEQEIQQGIVDRAIVDGLISEEEPEEDRNQKLQGLLTSIPNKDADAKFLLDHYQNDFGADSPEALEKAPTIQKYLSLKQVSPNQIGELQGLVDGYVSDKVQVKNARLSAVDRGDYRVVAIDEDGGRQLYTGADTKPDNLNGELDTLIGNGAISASDLSSVKRLTMPINGGQATVAEGTRYNVFANSIQNLAKKDPTLRSSIDQEAARIRETKRVEQLTTGETIFDYVKKAVAIPLDLVGNVVTEAFGLAHPEEPVAPPSELIGGNKAITGRFSASEVNQFLGDYMKHASGPYYRADRPETGIDTDSLGNVIVSPALIGNKTQFEQALKMAPLNDDQKERATIQRQAMLETEAPKILKLILGESSEAASAYAVARASGKKPYEFIEEWVGNNSQNYDGMSERLQQLGMSTFSAIATLPVGIGALMGIEPAAKALVAMNKEQSDREEYARLFGDEFGFTFQLINTIPQVATDILATIGTQGLYTGIKGIAKGSSKAIVREATRGAMSMVDDTTAAVVKNAATAGGEALVGEALEKVGGSLATSLAKADKLVPLFATSFTRSASSTYGSIYGQLPDGMSADEKHRNAFGYAIASGLSTAIITSGMSFLGEGGIEDLATGKFRPITAVDDTATNVRKVSLGELNYKQAKFLNENLNNAGAKLTDKAFKDALVANIGGAYKSYIRTTLRGGVSEGFEEALDQAIQSRIEDASLDKNTPLSERVNQIWSAFALGGLMGGIAPAIGQVVKPLDQSEMSMALDARASVLSKVANDLRKTGSTATAEILQRQLNDAQAAANAQRQTEIAAQQQKELRSKTEEVVTQADKPLTFDPLGQAELPLGDTRAMVLPPKTRFLTDFNGERAYLGSYAGTLEVVGDEVRLNLDEAKTDGITHLVVGNKFQPIDKSGIRLDRKRLMLTGEHNGTIPAGTPYVIPDPRKKFKFAFPTDSANVSFVQDMANAPALRINNARVIGQENVSSSIVLTDKGQIEDALRYYNLDPAVLMQPENVGQLELNLFDDEPAVEAATTPVANPTAVVETPIPPVLEAAKKGRGKKGKGAVTEAPLIPTAPSETDPTVVVADAIETGDTPPPRVYSEEQEYVRDVVMDNQLTAALLSVKANGFTPEEINKVANGFAPEVFSDLKNRIDEAIKYTMGLDDSLADVRSNILSNLTDLEVVYNRVKIAQFIEAKPAVVAAPIAEEAPAVAAPTKVEAKKTTTKKKPVTPLPNTTVVSDEENPSDDAADLREELTNLNTTVPVFDVDGELTTLESLEVQLQQLDNRIEVAKANGSPIPSGVKDIYSRLKSSVNKARFAIEGKSKELKVKIKELTAPDTDVDIRTDAQKNADELFSIMRGEQQVSSEVAAAAAAVKPTPSKFKEAFGVGPVKFKGEAAQPIIVFRDGVFRNTEEANLYTNWVAGGFMISNLAEHGFDPKKVSGIDFQSHSTEIKQRLSKDIQERFPFIPVPKGTPTTKSKRRVAYMTKAGDNYIDVPYEADSDGKPIRGVFTNDPLVTAQQIDMGLMIIIPKSVAKSAGFSKNPSIDVKDNGKGSLVVTSVKRHPFDTGVFVAGDISLVGNSGYTPKKALTSLGDFLRPPAPQFLGGAGPSARNKADNTFETYMNDMMSVSHETKKVDVGFTSKRSSFGSFENLITNSFGLSEDNGRRAMSEAQVSYSNNLKEYALAKKIQSALTKAQLKNPSATLIDLNLSKIILEETVSKGYVTPKPNEVADAIKKVYGLTGGSAEGIISNYGQYLYDSITSGDLRVGVKPFKTHVRNAAKRYQVSETRRDSRSRGNSATTQEEYEFSLNSLLDPKEDVVESTIRLLDTSTLNQLVNTLRVNTKAYDSLFKIVRKSYPDISEDTDEQELIDLAGTILGNYQKEEHIKLARDLKNSREGLDLANVLIDVGWLPPVDDEIVTPKQTAGTPTQLKPLPEGATLAQKQQRLRLAKRVVKASIGVHFSEADGRLLADEARKVNNAEIKRLGIVSNDPESVIAALRDIQESGTSMQRLVAGVLTANVDLIRNVRFVIGDMNDVRFAGAFMPKSNLVAVNISGHNGRGIVDVLLHEYLHAVTVQTMTNPRTPAQVVALQRIASLRALTASQAAKMGLDTEGFETAFTDDLEFITLALTAPEFQSLVRAATPTAQRSLLSRIWESLRSLFGYATTDKKMADAFDELLDFTQMFAGANTFNIKAERNLRLDAHKIEEGLGALREFAKVKGQLRSNSNVLLSAKEQAQVVGTLTSPVASFVDSINTRPLSMFRSQAAIEDMINGKGGVLGGLTVAADGTVPWQSLSAKITKGFSKGEASLVIPSLEGLVVNGRIDADKAITNLQALASARISVSELSDEQQDPYRSTEVRYFSDRMNSIEQELSDKFPNYYGGEENYDDDEEFVRLNLEYKMLEDKLDSAVAKSRSNAAANPNIPASKKFRMVNPKSLANMEDVRDIVVENPSSEKLFNEGLHYPNRNNIIGFGRSYTETLPNGQKATFLFEVQSDWATKGDTSVEPLLAAYETLVLKAAISDAISRGQNYIVLPDAETAMITEGHDALGNLNEFGRPRTEVGMRAAYAPRTGRLHILMSRLTKNNGEAVDMGKMQQDRSVVFSEQPPSKLLSNGRIGVPKIVKKATATGIAYDLSNVDGRELSMLFSVARQGAAGAVAVDVVSELKNQLPEGMSVNVDNNLKGEAGIRRSQPNVIHVNPELLANRVAGLSEDVARAIIRGLVNHEVAHFAALNAFTPEHIARVATELGEDQLQKVAEQYYSTAGLTAEEILANIQADRESGVLSNERLADEWIRMQIEKAVAGQTYEDVIRGTKGNQTLISTIVDAIKAFVTRLRQRFVDYPSAETAAAISHASRTLRKINENKSTNINANPYAEDSNIRYSVGVIESIDKDYLAAVAAGDLQKAQQLVDAAAQTFGAEPYYRGGETFVVADTRKPYVWMAKDRDYAKNYGVVKKYFALTKNALDLTEFGTDQIFRMTRADIAKMFAAKGVNINQEDIDISKLGGGEPLFRALTTDRSGRIKKAITDAGYDAIKFYETRGIEAPPAKEVIAVFNPSQIKSADAITRDDVGNIIPLSKRFQVEKDDIRYSRAFRNEENIYAEGQFGDTANFFASLDGAPVGDQVSYSIPVLSSNAGKVDAVNERMRLYNLPSKLRDIMNLRSGTVNQIAASSKALVKYFPKYRDLALKGGVSMDDIKLLFGTTAPPLTDSDLKGIADKALIFEGTIPVTETEGRKADLVAEYSEKLKRERRLRFNDAFVKLQQAAEQSITDAGFGQLVKEAIAFREDINKFKGLTGFDESNDVYLTRAYKFFNTEGWSLAAKSGGVIKIDGKDVDFGKLRDAAAAAYYEESEAEFQKIGKPYTDKDVTDLTLSKLDKYLATLETMNSTVDRQVVDSIRKDLNRFKPKKDIDSTFRELLGEIDDPLANAVNTLYRVGMLDANEKFRTNFAKTAQDLGLASKDAKAGWVTAFASSSAPRTGDLAGLYFDPKVAGVLNEVFGANMTGLNSNSTNLMNNVGRVAMGVSGLAIQMKTQLGIGYWPRNAIGGYVLSAAQGIFMNPLSAKGKQAMNESWKASFASLPTDQAQRESILRLVKLNVLNDQSQGRVAQDLLRGLIASPQQELQDLMAALDEARATKDAGGVFARLQQSGYIKGGFDKALSVYSTATDKLAALDGALDGMFKANAYYYELAVIKKHFDTMPLEQQEEAAARKVKLCFAGNSQVIDLVKSFNKTPMAALFLPFARWKSEVFRTMLNTIPLAMEEIGQGGAMARRGVQRLAGFIGTLTVAPIILSAAATTVFRALAGDDEEEERKLTTVELAALRESLPLWQRGHQLVAQILKGGKIQFIDMSYILPHSQLTDIVAIITDGIKTGEGINASRLASYVTGDLIGTQIAATSIDEILNNADDRGQPIYLETDNAARKMQRMLGHYAKGAVIPSSISKGIDIARKGQTNAAEIFWGEILGSRPKTVTFGEVERRGFRNLKGLLDDSVSIIGDLTSGRFKSDDEINEVVDRHQDALNETQRRLNRFMRSMVSMGSTESSVYSSAKMYKFSDDTIGSAYQGYRIAWRPNDKWNQKTYFNAEQAGEQDPAQKLQSVSKSVNRKGAVNYISGPYDE